MTKHLHFPPVPWQAHVEPHNRRSEALCSIPKFQGDSHSFPPFDDFSVSAFRNFSVSHFRRGGEKASCRPWPFAEDFSKTMDNRPAISFCRHPTG
jgi:hypothetical protein